VPWTSTSNVVQDCRDAVSDGVAVTEREVEKGPQHPSNRSTGYEHETGGVRNNRRSAVTDQPPPPAEQRHQLIHRARACTGLELERIRDVVRRMADPQRKQAAGKELTERSSSGSERERERDAGMRGSRTNLPRGIGAWIAAASPSPAPPSRPQQPPPRDRQIRKLLEKKYFSRREPWRTCDGVTVDSGRGIDYYSSRFVICDEEEAIHTRDVPPIRRAVGSVSKFGGEQ
jgi:hypothetical protein